MYSDEIGARVVLAASRFLGLSELWSEEGWRGLDLSVQDELNSALRMELYSLGWHSQWPYASAFVQASWTKAYQGRAEVAKIRVMLEAGPLQTWKNAVEAEWTSQAPRIGAIGVLKNGEKDNGHVFIVRATQGFDLFTLESGGPGEPDREAVHKRVRQLVYSPNSHPHLLGFILPHTESE